METIETVPQKVVEQKIVILKARLDPNKVKSLGEEKKRDFFVRSKFLKHKPADTEVGLIGFSKYYEPFIIIGGRYSIDYCKKHLFEIKTDNKEDRLFVGGEEKRLEPCDTASPNRMFKLVGEERCHYEDETFIVLDRLKREVPIEKLLLAPFEEEPENIDTFDLRKVNISVDDEIDLIKSKIVNRPSNSDFIIKEIFEINDRMIVYNPIYELVFQDLKTTEETSILVEGISGKISISRIITSNHEKLPYSEKTLHQHIPKVYRENSSVNNSNLAEPKITSNKATEIINQSDSSIEKEKITDLSQSKSNSDVENALFLAKNLLRRLGFKQRITPLKVIQENDAYVVELSMEDRTAKVIVNTKTKEVKEYDIQNTDSF